MKKIIIILATALLFTGCDKPPPSKNGIVSMAPNVTEILYALDLEDQIVGVSKFSNYPPEAKEKSIVGGTYDPNLEMIVSLQPSLVIGLDSQKEIAVQLKQLGIDFLGVPHERVTEIMQSILIIGEACDAQEKAEELFQSLEAQIKKVPTIGKDEKPQVLVCIGHDEQLTRMYIAARNTFYDDLITLAGGINACEQTAIKYPEISPEGLHAMKPDIVIDLVPNSGKKASNDWKPYRAVTMTNDYAFIPGPRFALLLEDFIRAINE